MSDTTKNNLDLELIENSNLEDLQEEDSEAKLIKGVTNLIKQDRKETQELLDTIQDIFDNIEQHDEYTKTKEERVELQKSLIALKALKQNTTKQMIDLIKAVKKPEKIEINFNKGINTGDFINDL